MRALEYASSFVVSFKFVGFDVPENPIRLRITATIQNNPGLGQGDGPANMHTKTVDGGASYGSKK